MLALVSSSGRRAQAQELDDQTRSAARQLATEGSAFYEHNDFEAACDRFGRAYQLVQKPNVGIWLARSLVRAGRLVEASERYLELERVALEPGAPADQQQAVAAAATERQQLLPRLPSVTVVVAGADPSAVFVSLNGKVVNQALIGVRQPVNPGTLVAKAVRGEQVVTAKLQLREAESREIRLEFAPAFSAPGASESRAGASASRERTATSGAAEPNSSLRLLGFAGLGLGGASLITGGVFGILALRDKQQLDSWCPNHACGPAEHDLVDAYATKGTICGTALISGAVLATAGGAVLLLSAPPKEGHESRLQPYLTPGGAGLWGAF